MNKYFLVLVLCILLNTRVNAIRITNMTLQITSPILIISIPEKYYDVDILTDVPDEESNNQYYVYEYEISFGLNVKSNDDSNGYNYNIICDLQYKLNSEYCENKFSCAFANNFTPGGYNYMNTNININNCHIIGITEDNRMSGYGKLLVLILILSCSLYIFFSMIQ